MSLELLWIRASHTVCDETRCSCGILPIEVNVMIAETGRSGTLVRVADGLCLKESLFFIGLIFSIVVSVSSAPVSRIICVER